MKRLITGVVSLLIATQASAGSLKSYEVQAGLTTTDHPADALKTRLGFVGPTVNMTRINAAIAGQTGSEDYRLYSSIFFKDILQSTTSELQKLIELGAPIVYDPSVDREERINLIQRFRNSICFMGLKKANSVDKASDVTDAILTKLAIPEFAQVASVENDVSKKPAGPFESIVQNEITASLSKNLSAAAVIKNQAVLGLLERVDVVKGHVFRLQYASSTGPVLMSLSTLLTFLSGEDDAYLSTLDCLTQIYSEQQTLFRKSLRHDSLTLDEKALLEKYLEGHKADADYLDQRLKVLDVVQSYLAPKLLMAIQTNQAFKKMDSLALRVYLAAFLDFQKDEIPSPAKFPILNDLFIKQLAGVKNILSPKNQTEIDYMYYHTISRLMRKMNDSLDWQSLNHLQYQKDKKMLGITN